MNKFIGIGNISQEISLRFTPNGKAVASTSIAINEGYGDNQQTTFLNVVIWGKTAEAVAEYSKKGDKIAIEGRVSVRSYDKDGSKRWVTEIVAERVEFLGSKKSDNSEDKKVKDPFVNDSRTIDISDDLPF